MPVTGLANLAVKVADLDAACAFYDAAGAEVRDRMTSYKRAAQGAGTVQIWIIDPAGNTIELQQEA